MSSKNVKYFAGGHKAPETRKQDRSQVLAADSLASVMLLSSPPIPLLSADIPGTTQCQAPAELLGYSCIK